MRLSIIKSAHSVSYSVIKSAFINGKRTSVTVEKLGNAEHICKTYGVDDAEAWARDYVAALNKKKETAGIESTITFNPDRAIDADKQRSYNGGYLFLQQIYHELGLDKIAKAIKKKHSFDYNLNSILSRLIYSRIIYPSSKLSSYEQSKKFIEQPDFDLQHIYRSLSILSQESDYIQSALYKNSLKLNKRKTGIVYYDCTNFFFECEQAYEGSLKQYGVSKENRPNPIVQMGLFMDGEGIPLAFCINPGNTNEQLTLKPLEEKLLSDFSLSKFVVCTDAGISSMDNRKFNNEGDRAYVTTQSLKKIKKHLKEWALDTSGWRLSGSKKQFNINEIDEDMYHDSLFYKDRWINEDGLEQHLIVSYSIKTRNFQRSLRDRQIERAKKLIENDRPQYDHKKQTDFRRLVNVRSCTEDGEIASRKIYELDDGIINEEERYDGFYAVCTNLEGNAEDILKINQRRWEIEDCFRVLKTEFRSRPVYLQRNDRITAHFMTCFIALIVLRYLEKKLDEKYTCKEIIDALKEMDFLKLEGHGYIPTYRNTELIKALHRASGFDTAKEIISITAMKDICAKTKR